MVEVVAVVPFGVPFDDVDDDFFFFSFAARMRRRAAARFFRPLALEAFFAWIRLLERVALMLL